MTTIQPDSASVTAESRLDALTTLLTALEPEGSQVDEGQFRSVSMLVVDSVLASDQAALVQAVDGLQRLYGEQRREASTPERLEQQGRILGVLDAAYWGLRRLVPDAGPPQGRALQFLLIVKNQGGIRNLELAAGLGVADSQISRLGRQLVQAGLARKRRIGRENHWEITSRGALCLRRVDEGQAQSESVFVPVRRDVLGRLEGQVAALHKDVAVPRSFVAPLVGEVLAHVLGSKRPLSSNDVAESTGLSRALVANAVALLGERMLVSHDQGATNYRRVTSSPITVHDERFAIIGVKILPDKLVGIVTNMRGKEVVRYRTSERFFRRTLGSSAPADVIAGVVELVRDIRSSGDRFRLPPHLIGLGIELGGHVNEAMGEVVLSPNLGWDKRVGLGQSLRRQTGLVTVVENDANAIAVYEHLFGVARGNSWFAAVLYGWGIGSGLVLDGQLTHGESGLAGELGHIQVEPNGPDCGCGKRGCLESIASVSAVLRDVQRLKGDPSIDFAEAVRLADYGDQDIRNILVQSASYVGAAISDLLNLLNLEKVVISVPPPLHRSTDMKNAFGGAVRHAMDSRAFSSSSRRCKVVIRPLHDSFGARGAAASLLRRFLSQPLTWPLVATASDEGVRGNPARYGFGRKVFSVRVPTEQGGFVVVPSVQEKFDAVTGTVSGLLSSRDEDSQIRTDEPAS